MNITMYTPQTVECLNIRTRGLSIHMGQTLGPLTWDDGQDCSFPFPQDKDDPSREAADEWSKNNCRAPRKCDSSLYRDSEPKASLQEQ